MKTNKKPKAKKSLGQNFLKSEMILRKIVEAGEIKRKDVILEIGPGRGALTKQLLGSSDQVLAIEKDRELIEFLKEKFKKEIEDNPPSHKATDGQRKLILINEDILDFNLKYKLLAKSYKLIANIPYNITGAILKKFLTTENQPESMILMVQHEVATRILARNKKESILSISVKAYGEPKMVAKVDKRYFSPAPKVNSAIISIKNISHKIFKENDINEEKFWEMVKAGFAHKRKKLSSNLKVLKYIGNFSVETLGNKRAEDLSLADWIELTKNF
ncbi:ribosomal RNA small subunit methyltransferase A [Patescibacteria group bacterium]|nr:ribosomal RNA small subunit methyltransferase A [Patescibacteria group bacterium]